MEKRNHRPLRREGIPQRKTKSEYLVIGLRPVAELIRSDKETDRVFLSRELLQRNEGLELQAACKQAGIPLQVVPVEKLNRITPKMHQGAVAFISPIAYQKSEFLVPALFEEGENPFLLVLDRITDVRNFGAIARTAECAGVHALLVPEKGGAQIGEDALKTSAGALNHIAVCREKDLSGSLNFLLESGLTLVACTEKGNESLFNLNLKGPVAIIMGSEEDGISPALMEKAHHRASLPQAGKIASLNVSVAAGIALFEVLRQRNPSQQ
jgi:23S rRNA (guanosine2251-2'-O)-methyltransferase